MTPTMREKIARLVDARGYSQEQFEARVGLARNRMAKWNGGTGEPTGRQLLRIARELGVSMEYLADDYLDSPECGTTRDDRAIIQLVHDLRLTRAEAVRRLSLPPGRNVGGAVWGETFEVGEEGGGHQDDDPAGHPQRLPPPKRRES